VQDQRGLSVCGFGWEGIGINDMIKSATAAAERIIRPSSADSGGPEIKGVYF
jgi:oxygen-dependent protoporphyrinogen oxidase